VAYRGKRISLNLVDADLKQVFRLFHEISGLNFVLDPDVTGRVTRLDTQRARGVPASGLARSGDRDRKVKNSAQNEVITGFKLKSCGPPFRLHWQVLEPQERAGG